MQQIVLHTFLICILITSDVWSQQPATNSLPSVIQEKDQKGTPPTLTVLPGEAPIFLLKDWKERVIQEEGFAVAFPASPAKRTRPVENAQMKFEWREYFVVSSTGRYEVRIADSFGRRKEDSDVVRQRLEVVSQGIERDPEYSDVTHNFLTLNGHPAVDIKYKYAKGVGLGWIRMTMIDGRIYQLNIEALAKSGWPKEAELFVNSFRLLENAALPSSPISGEIIYPAKADLKPKIISMPPIKYTDQARNNGVEGTIAVSAVFTSAGTITGIRIIRGLPDGLNEEAIKAVSQVKFKPAMKDGQPVSVRMTLEYTINRIKN